MVVVSEGQVVVVSGGLPKRCSLQVVVVVFGPGPAVLLVQFLVLWVHQVVGQVLLVPVVGGFC